MAKETKPTVHDGYTGRLSLKVSKSGGIQLDGMRRFPITLYRDEMEAILSRADAIRAFIALHNRELKVKGDNPTAKGGGEAI
jgi:hypothetical protein